MASRKIGTKKKAKKKTRRSRRGAVSTPSSPIKVNFATYARNNGDGSVSNLFFKNAAEAEAYAEPDDERHCEDVQEHSFTVNPGTGDIIGGLEGPREPEPEPDDGADDDDDEEGDTGDLED